MLRRLLDSPRSRSLSRSLLVVPLLGVMLSAAAFPAWSSAATEAPGQRLPEGVSDSPLLNSRFLLFGNHTLRRQTLRWAMHNRETQMVAAIIHAMRFLDEDDREYAARALRKITGARIEPDWFKWMQWQQAHPEIQPFEGFDLFLAGLLGGLDENYKTFIYPGVAHRIRLEEIAWGGVPARDGIPPLDHPKMLLADEAPYMRDTERVFGIEINGDARAYPHRFMDWHEMLNDTIGGQPVSLAYCTLCASGILFDTRREDSEAFTFGSSGLLYRSNKLMFDYASNSLWNQFTGEPVVGTLARSGIALPVLPVVTTSWEKWREAHPATTVVAMGTGFQRDYRPGKAYGHYFGTADLMFPTLTGERALRQKEQVFGLRMAGAHKAWPLKRFRGGVVLNDIAGTVPIVLIGNAKTRDVRAYRREAHEFEFVSRDDLTSVQTQEGVWRVSESELVGPNNQRLPRLPGHLAFWFAWHNYFGAQTLAEE